MSESFVDFLDELEASNGSISAVPVKADTRPEFPCTSCNGTGTWNGGGYRTPKKCFACKGKGSFKTSQQDRRKARAQSRASKARTLQNKQEALIETHGELITALAGMTSWNDFAKSLIEQFEKKGQLSDKQIAAAERMVAKVAATRAAKNKERNANCITVELSPIRDMFNLAVQNGLKRTKYRAEGLILSRAPDHGKNAGFLYVKTEGDEYQGKIDPNGTFIPVGTAAENTKDSLTAIAKDPREAAVRWGQKTGSCSCCGRELTNATSIELGIGPICAEKWGL